MRLDLLLKQSGLIKRRTIAQEFCERGLVFVNDNKAKPSKEIKDGDELKIIFGDKIMSFQIRFEIEGKKTTINITATDVSEVDKIDA